LDTLGGQGRAKRKSQSAAPCRGFNSRAVQLERRRQCQKRFIVEWKIFRGIESQSLFAWTANLQDTRLLDCGKGKQLKKWYQKKKVWAAILGALLPVLTLLLAPKDVETVKVLAAAIIEAGVAAGFIFAEASIDKAGTRRDKARADSGLAMARSMIKLAEAFVGEKANDLAADVVLSNLVTCHDCAANVSNGGNCGKSYDNFKNGVVDANTCGGFRPKNDHEDLDTAGGG